MREDIERLAADELAKIDRHRRALERLRDDPTFVLLRDAQLSGVTRQRWEVASAAVVSATSRLAKSRDTVNDAIRLLRANPPDPEEAERLLKGPSVPLTPAETPKKDRRPPASGSSEPRFTLRAVKDFVADDLRTAQRIVDNVAAVLAVARPRLEQLTARFDEADSQLGHATAGGTRAELAALRRGLDDAWRLLATDPLALRSAGAPGPNGRGRLDLSRLEAIDAELTRLASAGAPWPTTADRLDRLRTAVGELDTLESRARARRDALLKRFIVADVPPAPAAAADLSARVGAAGTRPQADELDEVDRAVAAAVLAANEVARWTDKKFEEWDLLRARLETYRLRAARLGHATRPDLAALHRRARQILETIPCDLRLADEAVRDYMSMEHGDRRGEDER
jgi:hypothetical protein